MDINISAADSNRYDVLDSLSGDKITSPARSQRVLDLDDSQRAGSLVVGGDEFVSNSTKTRNLDSEGGPEEADQDHQELLVVGTMVPTSSQDLLISSHRNEIAQ